MLRISEKENKHMKKKGLLLTAMLTAAIFILSALSACSGGDAPEIEVVRNGYLGEYTDLTVEEILNGHYTTLGYDEAAWSSGTTNSGKTIVEARFSDDVAIQFTMLNETCFCVSAYVDPMETTTKATDLLAVLNYLYLEQYLYKNADSVGDAVSEEKLIARLDSISGSAVQYGAANHYVGDRGNICRLDNESPLTVSVAWLLDNYGYIDMGNYWN